ncbi:hypothetical protein Sulku_2018 [Sulfuricurvum kujiense DSM 16994]|uniref:DUF4282 domain-containing protein n=1 Tax=Sulfuricurvum kujiense (strain ATCC BAA-921 / DSM 16994 / JCM 11577 / YK-1) TaxID=709032 RepID=E4U2J1_SULKY|nr:DUF4282 domain-containing protein [Sulfuricurvum kujiense]ADR34678.1 hypothetical protein Sulku_2018 [Sulfuricurvum kujiense DSM 16994]
MEFLSFETFVSVPLLIAVYYAGAFLVPVLLFFQRKKLFAYARIANEKLRFGRVKWVLLLTFAFVVFQIFWRMMFEMIIGYFQMRDYLQQLTG